MKKPLLISFVLFYIVVVLIVGYLFSDNNALLLVIIFSTVMVFILIGFLIQFNYKRINDKIDYLEKGNNASYSQIESLFSIFSILKITKPLPAFRGWAISPDFANIIIQKILEKKPGNILECGSGVSSLIISYLIHDKDWGNLISFEHDKEFADRTNELLKSHVVSGKTIIYSNNLINYTIENEDWKWYDISLLNPDIKFDVIIIDGPPAFIHPKSRYPSLFLLDKYLNKGGIILLDDCLREDDNNIVKQWMTKFSNYSEEWFNTEKGTYQLVKLS